MIEITKEIKNIDIGLELNLESLEIDLTEEIYYDFFLNTTNFLYNIWNIKIIDYDGKIKNKEEIKKTVLKNNELIFKDTMVKELDKLTFEKQKELLFFNNEEYKNKLKFYIKYTQLQNEYKEITIENLLDINEYLEELNIFFEKKI